MKKDIFYKNLFLPILQADLILCSEVSRYFLMELSNIGSTFGVFVNCPLSKSIIKTSSIGNDNNCGNEFDVIPTKNGIGAQQ